MVTARQIAVGLIVIWLAIIVYAAIFVTTPDIGPVRLAQEKDQTMLKLPSVHYEVRINFRAKGAFSVNNPVHIVATIKDVNITNFLQYYSALGYTDSYFSPPKYGPDKLLLNGWIPIEQGVNGTYKAEGDLVWLVEGPTWVFLVPRHEGEFKVTEKVVSQGDPILTISGAQDTLAMQNNEITLRLTWVLVAFSILMLQPILEALLKVRREERKR